MNRYKTKGRREKGAFVQVPLAVLQHPNIENLSPTGCKLLLALLGQLRFGKSGLNNGDLCAAYSLMKSHFKGKDTLQDAIQELQHYGFITLTRQGERLAKGKPNLYAFTFLAIDECGGKLDVKTTTTPTGEWKQEREKYVKQATLKRRKRNDNFNSSPRQTGQVYPGKQGGKLKSEVKTAVSTPANRAKTDKNDDFLPRQTGYFLESAIGTSLNSPSAHIQKSIETGSEQNLVSTEIETNEQKLERLSHTVNQKKQSIRRGIDEHTET